MMSRTSDRATSALIRLARNRLLTVTGRGRPAAFFQAFGQLPARKVPGREKASRQAGTDGDNHRENQNRTVHPDG